MGKLKKLSYVLIVVTMGITAVLNVNKALKANKSVNYSTTTLTVMGESANGESELFSCKTIITLTHDDFYNCYECGRYHKRVTSETYECNKGAFPVGSCDSGYKHFYYDCQNNVSRTLDMTDTHFCTLY